MYMNRYEGRKSICLDIMDLFDGWMRVLFGLVILVFLSGSRWVRI